jgi:SagB-type dehydrogenase family enzyme
MVRAGPAVKREKGRYHRRTRNHTTRLLFRRSAHLVAYWAGTSLRVRNFAIGTDVRVPKQTCDILDLFAEWRSIRDAARANPSLDVRELRQRIAALHAAGLLLRSDEPLPRAEMTMSQWRAWNPAVGLFHSMTRNMRFTSMTEGREQQRLVAAAQPWPGPMFVPRSRVAVRLPPPGKDSAVTRAFVERRSWRRFREAPLTLRRLSTLLWLTGGIHRFVENDYGEFALKTSPSGGSLHPIELYVLARRVERLPAGFYHYSGADHRLRRVKKHARRVPVERYLPEQPWFEGAGAVVFLVAHYERSLWRYNYPRAYRAPFIEAGHLAQTFCVKATEMGLAPFVSMALADRNIEKEIGADGISRSVLYATGVGLRPAGVEWAPLPEGMGTLTGRVNRPRVSR